VFTACAAAAFCRRDAFETVGGFDESFFCYVEDVDLGFRLRLLGETCIQVPAAVVRHVGSISSGGAGSAFARYHGTRNLIWCFVKNMPWPIFWPVLPLHLIVPLLLWLRALPRGMGGAVARGIGDGLAGLGRVWTVRRTIQAQRRASVWEIARVLTWDLREFRRRAPANRL